MFDVDIFIILVTFQLKKIKWKKSNDQNTHFETYIDYILYIFHQ